MTVKEIDVYENDFRKLIGIYEEAFPEHERISEDNIKELCTRGGRLYGAYFDDILVGIAIIVMNDEIGYVYFLAVDREYRNRGIGGEFLRKLTESFGKRSIVLDFEELIESVPDIELRKRRKAFYLRNGMKETGRYTLLDGGYRFEVVSSTLPFNSEALLDVMKTIHGVVPKYPAAVE